MFDAWAYSIPCVVTPVGGLPDIVIDGENALVFPVGDVDMLSSQLKKMISDDFCVKNSSSFIRVGSYYL